MLGFKGLGFREVLRGLEGLGFRVGVWSGRFGFTVLGGSGQALLYEEPCGRVLAFR